MFAKLKEMDWVWFMDERNLVIRKWRDKDSNDVIPYDPCLSPMEQDVVIEELLKLKQ